MPLWDDVVQRHNSQPFHAFVGGGDQLYNDPVWKTDPLIAWTSITNKAVSRRHNVQGVTFRQVSCSLNSYSPCKRDRRRASAWVKDNVLLA